MNILPLFALYSPPLIYSTKDDIELGLQTTICCYLTAIVFHGKYMNQYILNVNDPRKTTDK